MSNECTDECLKRNQHHRSRLCRAVKGLKAGWKVRLFIVGKCQRYWTNFYRSLFDVSITLFVLNAEHWNRLLMSFPKSLSDRISFIKTKGLKNTSSTSVCFGCLGKHLKSSLVWGTGRKHSWKKPFAPNPNCLWKWTRVLEQTTVISTAERDEQDTVRNFCPICRIIGLDYWNYL